MIRRGRVEIVRRLQYHAMLRVARMLYSRWQSGMYREQRGQGNSIVR